MQGIGCNLQPLRWLPSFQRFSAVLAYLTMSHKSKQQQLLTFGYVRKNYALFIPFVIIKLIKLFYDEYFYWHIKGDEMVKFKQAQNGDILYPKSTIKFNDIVFQCTLCPNGWKSNNDGRVQFYAETKSIPKHVANITFVTELACETIPRLSHGIINRKKTGSGIGWNIYLLILNELQDLDEIRFYCLIKLKYIKFKNHDDEKKYKDQYYIKPTPLSKISKFTWNIDKETMNKMKNLGRGQGLFSPLLCNETWRMRAVKRGDKNVQINLLCCSYPKDIHRMRIKYLTKYQINEEMDAVEVSDECDISEQTVIDIYTKRKLIISVGDLQDIDGLNIDAVVEIERLINEEKVSIDKQDFDKYDIIM